MPTAFIRLVPAPARRGRCATLACRDGVHRTLGRHRRATHGCGTAACRTARVPAA